MIKKITITIGGGSSGKDIELTLKQAKELKKDLDLLLETKTELLPNITWPVYPQRIDDTRPIQPFYDSGHFPDIHGYRVTCDTGVIS